MENVKILVDGIQKDVYGIFYLYNSKYYFIYTEKEVDENGYVLLYMSQIGKETKNTQEGIIETGYMIGVEVVDSEEQKKAQESVSYIVEDKKNNTKNSQIQYLPMSMLANLKIVSKKRFRLLKSIMIENFKLTFENNVMPINISNNIIPDQISEPIVQEITSVPVQTSTIQEAISIPIAEVKPIAEVVNEVGSEIVQASTPKVEIATEQIDTNVIIDYRTKYFEEEEKNQQLQTKIDELSRKLEEIRNVIDFKE